MSVLSSDIFSKLTDLRIIQHRLHLGSAESLAQAQRSETEARRAPYVPRSPNGSPSEGFASVLNESLPEGASLRHAVSRTTVVGTPRGSVGPVNPTSSSRVSLHVIFTSNANPPPRHGRPLLVQQLFTPQRFAMLRIALTRLPDPSQTELGIKRSSRPKLDRIQSQETY